MIVTCTHRKTCGFIITTIIIIRAINVIIVINIITSPLTSPYACSLVQYLGNKQVNKSAAAPASNSAETLSFAVKFESANIA